MKRLLQILCILMLAASYATARGSSPDSVAWKTWAAAWNTYINNPSTQNGERLYDLLPNTHIHSLKFDSSSYFLIYGNLGKLGELLLKQDRVAVRIAFKLFAVCDADFCETLDQILGHLIRKNPTMFLEELSKHREGIGHLGNLLCNLGDEFVDDTAKSNREMRLRITSLRRVHKASLVTIRDECVSELESHVR